MQSVLLKGDVLSPRGILNNHFLLFENRVIKDMSSKKPHLAETALFFDLEGFYILPGFIDLHLHGDPLLAARYFSRFGTTAFLSAIPSVSKSGLIRRIEYIKDLVSKNKLPSNILGIHLEGPYINKKMAGAQDRDFIRSIDLEEIRNLIRESGGIIKIVSLAPELDNSAALIGLLARNNIIPSLAHTNATFEEAVKAVNQGAIFSAHTFNRMGILHHRAPGALGAVLTDSRVFCEAILDGLHIDPALFKILLKCKGIEKIILSTDSIKFEDSIKAAQAGSLYRLKGGRIAGSSLTMNIVLRNAIKYGSLSLKDASALVTMNPARILGIDRRKGSLELGKDADIAVTGKDFKVVMTICEGRIVYQMKTQFTPA